MAQKERELITSFLHRPECAELIFTADLLGPWHSCCVRMNFKRVPPRDLQTGKGIEDINTVFTKNYAILYVTTMTYGSSGSLTICIRYVYGYTRVILVVEWMFEKSKIQEIGV